MISVKDHPKKTKIATVAISEISVLIMMQFFQGMSITLTLDLYGSFNLCQHFKKYI